MLIRPWFSCTTSDCMKKLFHFAFHNKKEMPVKISLKCNIRLKCGPLERLLNSLLMMKLMVRIFLDATSTTLYIYCTVIVSGKDQGPGLLWKLREDPSKRRVRGWEQMKCCSWRKRGIKIKWGFGLATEESITTTSLICRQLYGSWHHKKTWIQTQLWLRKMYKYNTSCIIWTLLGWE